MKYFSKLVLSAALVMGSFSGSLLADSFTFSYVFGDENTAPGYFSGSLTGIQSGDLVTVLNVDTLVVNGVTAPGTIFNASFDSGTGDFTNAGNAVVSFTLENNNFLFMNSDYAGGDVSGDTYAWINFNPPQDVPVAFAWYTPDLPSNDPGTGQWSLVNTTPHTPDGGATVGLLGLVLVGFAAVRRKSTTR